MIISGEIDLKYCQIFMFLMFFFKLYFNVLFSNFDRLLSNDFQEIYFHFIPNHSHSSPHISEK